MAKSLTLPDKLVHELNGHQGPIRAVRFNRNGDYCLTCSSDRTVRLWNPHKGTGIKIYKGPGQEVLDADVAHDNGRIVCGGADKQVLLMDVSTGQAIRKFRGHNGNINCVKFNDDSSLILSGSYDATLRAWDCRSRTYDPVQIMDEAKDSITSLHLSQHEILTGSVDGTVRRYDIRFGKLYSDTIGHPVTSVKFSQDGHCTLVSSLDDHIRLLDKDTGELLNQYTSHCNSEYKLDSCFTNDDAFVMSGSENGKIYFWDLVEATVTQTLEQTTPSSSKGRPCVIYSLSYHPSKICLLSAGSYGPVNVWKASDDENE